MILQPLQSPVLLNSNIEWGNGQNWVLFAGPDLLESEGLVLEVGQELKRITQQLGIPWVLKCSFDKANRSSSKSFRGLGATESLRRLDRIKTQLDVPLLTDIHECGQVAEVAKVAEVLQIPAFLSRQTDLIQTAASTGRVLNIKKGQFLAPWEMKSVAAKALEVGNAKVLLCERGTSFGYNRLVNDMTGLKIMRDQCQLPVVFDATHSVQLPGGLGDSSGGRREMIDLLARAAMAVGVDGLFFETHPDPDKALCDGPNSLALSEMPRVLRGLQAIWTTIQSSAVS
jgi:2-dehydro-3-deoxyphosphooctonate aldolase (KDO 8-P synthase)